MKEVAVILVSLSTVIFIVLAAFATYGLFCAVVQWARHYLPESE